jgi:hypothetical protein
MCFFVGLFANLRANRESAVIVMYMTETNMFNDGTPNLIFLTNIIIKTKKYYK